MKRQAGSQVSGEACALCVCTLLCVDVCFTGFSWLLNAILVADTPRAKLWTRLCGLVIVF